MRAIRKVTSGDQLTKQAMRNKNNTYILKLLLNVVTAGIETLIITGNKFLYVCVKEICCLSAESRFEPSINSSLLLKRCDPNQFFNQAVVTRSEIRAVRRVVKQLPVGRLQQCSGASSCMRTRIVMEAHYIGCQHSTPFVLYGPTQYFSVSQYASDVIVAPFT
jgi:hypothetical protein